MMLVYGSNPVAVQAVQAAIAANPGLYGQGPTEDFAPQTERIEAGFRLLTEHGFQLPHLHEEHSRWDDPVNGGFAYERATIPPEMRLSTLASDAPPRDYRPDDPADYQQFFAARMEADQAGYQYYRAYAPFGPAEFIVDNDYAEPEIGKRIFGEGMGGVGLYNSFSGDGSREHPYDELTLPVRRFLDLNPEFARFAGFTYGWRSKPKGEWTLWEMLQAESEATDDGFRVGEESRWRVDPEFGIQVLISDETTGVISLTHSSGRRSFVTLQDALEQVHLESLPQWKSELRPGAFFGDRGYILDEPMIIRNAVARIKWGDAFGSFTRPRKVY